jgi:hypothetical protein
VTVYIGQYLAALLVDAEKRRCAGPAFRVEVGQQTLDERGVRRARASHRVADPHDHVDEAAGQFDLSHGRP